HDLDSPNEVFRRYVSHHAFDATVAGIVAVVTHHEIVAGGDAILFGVVVKSVLDHVERRVAHSVGQGLAPLLDVDLAPTVVGLNKILDLLALHGRAVDVQETVYHLDAIARQPDHPFDVVDRRVFRQTEYDDITALRLRREDATRNQRQRRRE